MHHSTAVALRLTFKKKEEEQGGGGGGRGGQGECLSPSSLVSQCPAQPLCPRAWLMFLPSVGVAFVQLEESEFTCAAAVKARKAMEVEMEDLHLQIDDIAKAKTAVRGRVYRAGPGAEGELNHDCLHPTPAFTCQEFLHGSTLLSHPNSLLSPNSEQSLEGREGWQKTEPARVHISLFNHLPLGAWPQALES